MMLFNDLLKKSDDDDPRLRQLWKLALNSNLGELGQGDLALRQMLRQRIDEMARQEEPDEDKI